MLDQRDVNRIKAEVFREIASAIYEHCGSTMSVADELMNRADELEAPKPTISDCPKCNRREAGNNITNGFDLQLGCRRFQCAECGHAWIVGFETWAAISNELEDCIRNAADAGVTFSGDWPAAVSSAERSPS